MCTACADDRQRTETLTVKTFYGRVVALYEEGFGVEEISKILGFTTQTVRSFIAEWNKTLEKANV